MVFARTLSNLWHCISHTRVHKPMSTRTSTSTHTHGTQARTRTLPPTNACPSKHGVQCMRFQHAFEHGANVPIGARMSLFLSSTLLMLPTCCDASMHVRRRLICHILNVYPYLCTYKSTINTAKLHLKLVTNVRHG